jgi:hypothetical protein
VVLVGVVRVNERYEDEGIWLMYFMYLYKIENEIFCDCFKWGRKGIEGEMKRVNKTMYNVRLFRIITYMLIKMTKSHLTTFIILSKQVSLCLNINGQLTYW